jgi:hypothetical protein
LVCPWTPFPEKDESGAAPGASPSEKSSFDLLQTFFRKLIKERLKEKNRY